jgi:hypothetical protein
MLAALLLLLLLVTGCSRKVDGEIFIVQGGKAERLALVNIYAIPAANLAGFNEAAAKDLEALKSKYMKFVASVDYSNEIKQLDDMEAMRRQAFDKWAECAEKNISTYPLTCKQAHKSIEQEMFKVRAQLARKGLSFAPLAGEADGLTQFEVEFYAKELEPYLNGQGVQRATSDADGRFSLNLNDGEFVVVAVPREGAKSAFLWAFRLDKNAKKLQISNDQVISNRPNISSDCKACFIEKRDERFWKEDAKKISAFVSCLRSRDVETYRWMQVELLKDGCLKYYQELSQRSS